MLLLAEALISYDDNEKETIKYGSVMLWPSPGPLNKVSIGTCTSPVHWFGASLVLHGHND